MAFKIVASAHTYMGKVNGKVVRPGMPCRMQRSWIRSIKGSPLSCLLQSNKPSMCFGFKARSGTRSFAGSRSTKKSAKKKRRKQAKKKKRQSQREKPVETLKQTIFLRRRLPGTALLARSVSMLPGCYVGRLLCLVLVWLVVMLVACMICCNV